MRIKAADSSSVRIAACDAPGGAFLPGVLFGVLAALPWLLPEADAPRAAWSLLLAAVAAALLWMARPRARTLVLENGEDGFHAIVDGTRRGTIRRFALGGTEHEGPPRHANRYRVVGELADGNMITVVQAADPAEVIADLCTLQASQRGFPRRDHDASSSSDVTPLRTMPLEPGWGLDADALAILLAEPCRIRADASNGGLVPAGRTIELDVERSQREAAISVFVGAAGTALLVAAVFGRRLRHQQPISPLSIVLPALLVAFMALIGIAIRAKKVVVAIGSSLVVERRRFGRAAERQGYQLAELRGAWPVGPARGEVAHVLIATRRGALALPCNGSKAAELLDALAT